MFLICGSELNIYSYQNTALSGHRNTRLTENRRSCRSVVTHWLPVAIWQVIQRRLKLNILSTFYFWRLLVAFFRWNIKKHLSLRRLVSLCEHTFKDSSPFAVQLRYMPCACVPTCIFSMINFSLSVQNEADTVCMNFSLLREHNHCECSTSLALG